MYDAATGNTYCIHYVSEVSGTVMGIYTTTQSPMDTDQDPQLKEVPFYGTSRLGVLKVGATDGGLSVPDQYLYQLTDHLGNVRAVIYKSSGGTPVVVARTDYYPFEMPMPNRNVEGDYRYKFQGQEKDTETGMEAFKLRLWDARIGRWLTTDPYRQYFSPYLGMGNNPINGVDPDGGCFTTDKDSNTIPCPDNMAAGSTIMSTDGFEYTIGDDGVWWSDAAFSEYGTTVTADLGMQAYWRDVNALAVNLNKQKDLETGKSASIRMLEELEQEVAQTPLIIQFDEPTVIGGGGAMDLIGGKGAINLFKYLKNPNALKHIFRNTKGHVNPTTVTSQNRYLNLFNSVASDANNLVQTTNAAKINANVKTFHRTFRNGKQIWVETINGKIVNAGVNNIPR